MTKKEIDIILKLTNKVKKEDYKTFLIIKGFMIEVLNKKKVLNK